MQQPSSHRSRNKGHTGSATDQAITGPGFKIIPLPKLPKILRCPFKEVEQENKYAEGEANKGREGDYERRDPAT